MEFINITSSIDGTGMVIYDTIGDNTFQYCNYHK